MMQVFQYPFDFSMRGEFSFGTFLDHGPNAALLKFLQGFTQGKDQFCLLAGRSGCGKTHLLQALSQQHQEAVYLPLQFLAEHDPAILEGLQSYPLLVVDDLEKIAGSQPWEEAFFRLFNEAHAAGTRLCMAGQGAPEQLPWRLADLRSRLQLAVTFEVRELDEGNKRSVMLAEASRRGMQLKAEIVDYLLHRSSRNLRDLMQVLDRLDTLSLSEKRRLTIPFIRERMGW
jgi:DnaA family protein